MEKLRGFYHNRVVVFVGGLLLGALVILVIRFVTYAPEDTHYHANFAVYLNGQREEFKNPKYYQEVTACSADHIVSPQQRVHMHDQVNSAVHVHDHAVTWGNFFNNIGWSIGEDYIITDNGTTYKNDGDSKLHIYINGEDYTGLTAITNTVIKDQDRLLVSFGNLDKATLQREYRSVPSTARQYDNSKDPASCSGDHQMTISDRWQHLL